MNNRYFSCLLCITVLTFVPACYKKKPKITPQEDVATMIELDDSVFEIEEETENNDINVSKF